MGGALMILNHLVDHLVKRNVKFVLLKDVRCPELRKEKAVEHTIVMSSSVSARHKYYRAHRNDFSSVLCLGNVPPTIKLNVPVHTYIHNLSLLKIPKDYSPKWKIISHLKQWFIRFFSSNTDTWIVQTDTTQHIVNKTLNSSNKNILIYPFYYIPEDIYRKQASEREDYCFIGEYTYAKGHEYLIEAWRLLASKGFYKKLHLTVSDPSIISRINEAVKDGANINNHGYISFNEVIDIYNKCTATIYPSLNESLGLGIIEAAEAGCDVIGCNLPYMFSVCQPSEHFEPHCPESIVNAVLSYEANKNKTKLIIQDKVEEFIDFLLERHSKVHSLQQN